MGPHVNIFAVLKVPTPERVGTGLQALSREAMEESQPPCLGSEEKADFSSMASTVPKASTHN